jgi:hypothetical protein
LLKGSGVVRVTGECGDHTSRLHGVVAEQAATEEQPLTPRRRIELDSSGCRKPFVNEAQAIPECDAAKGVQGVVEVGSGRGHFTVIMGVGRPIEVPADEDLNLAEFAFSSAGSDDRERANRTAEDTEGAEELGVGPRPRFIAGAGDATASALLSHRHLLRSSRAAHAIFPALLFDGPLQASVVA